jgi:hypothetical protein
MDTPGAGITVFSDFPAASPSKRSTERRAADRFAMALDLTCKLLRKRNTPPETAGNTIDVSSAGILFTTAQVLTPGNRVELSINWPVPLNDKCKLILVARGRVARIEQGRAAAQIQQYEFRTKAAGNS